MVAESVDKKKVSWPMLPNCPNFIYCDFLRITIKIRPYNHISSYEHWWRCSCSVMSWTGFGRIRSRGRGMVWEEEDRGFVRENTRNAGKCTWFCSVLYDWQFMVHYGLYILFYLISFFVLTHWIERTQRKQVNTNNKSGVGANSGNKPAKQRWQITILYMETFIT